MENSMEAPQKIRTTFDSVMSLLGIYPKGTKAVCWRETCMPLFFAAWFTKAKIRIYPKCISTVGWIKKMQYAYTVEYFLSFKKDEILLFAKARRNLDIVIGNISHVQKDKCLMISLICGIQKCRSQKIR